MTQVIEDHPPVGLRERKKQQTRDALVDAAMRLFLEQGFERTTVDEIAAAVDVSPRTFFRYFETKDDVALAQVAQFDQRFLDALAARPAHEPPLVALTASLRAVWAPDDPEGEGGSNGSGPHWGTGSPTRHRELMRLVAGSPTLLAANLRRIERLEAALVRVVAGRTGAPCASDLEARLLVAAFSAAARVAIDEWTGSRDCGATAASLPDELGRCVSTMSAALQRT